MKEFNDLIMQSILALVYGALFVYIIKVQKTKKNMLFYVTCMLFCSAIFGLISITFLILCDINCDSYYETNSKQYTLTYIAFYCMQNSFFNAGIWILVYKYWEVSWIVPLQLKHITPS